MVQPTGLGSTPLGLFRKELSQFGWHSIVGVWGGDDNILNLISFVTGFENTDTP